MKKIILLNIALLLSVLGFSQTPEHVILITIDGFSPNFYLDPYWEASNLRSLMETGVHAYGVNSAFPSMTYPSHTSIVTGVRPAEHGIYYNGIFQGPQKSDSIYWRASSIKTPTLWDAATKAKLRTASVMWPVSAGAPVDYNIPDAGSMGPITYHNSKPLGFVEEVKKNAFGMEGQDMKFLYSSPVSDIFDYNVATVAAYLIEKHQPHLMTIHLLGVDGAQHGEGREGEKVRKAVRDADAAVGIILQSLKKAGIAEKSAVIVTGDHGFKSVDTTIKPNVWLKEAGLITEGEKEDWKAVFYPVGGAAFLHLKDKNDKETLQKVKDILHNRPPSEKFYFRTIDSGALEEVGADPNVKLALSGLSGAALGWGTDGPAVVEMPSIKGTHGYFPDFRGIQTGFIGNGPGFKSNVEVKEMDLIDIAPIVSNLLRLDFPLKNKPDLSQWLTNPGK